nr:DUF1634 domain-containing protein [Moorella sulfitireducens]
MVEDLISLALRVGVIISSIVTTGGLILLLTTGQSGYPDATFPTSIIEVLHGLIQLKSFAIIEFGLLILLATPIFWVTASTVAFFLRRDYNYTLISAYVLLILLLSLFLGKAG